MHFIHSETQPTDTIAACATAPGVGAISVIRISGSQAFAIAEKIFTKPVKSRPTHTAHYGQILDQVGTPIDSVLLLVMKGPKSYTGEDSIEISCHGGHLITRRVLDRIFEVGARPALPGEFSQRAFLNGKIDLAQAEAVQQLIASKSKTALHNAEKQLSGRLSKTILSFQEELTRIAAILEAWVDFPEEGLEFEAFDSLIAKLEKTADQIEHLASTFHEGKMLNHGVGLCLLGAPNVGKSSLMNALLGKERAIVTNIAGTTRDLLEEDLELCGFHFRLIDTAGIRETAEMIEQEGIRRSKGAMNEADLILLLLDASRRLQQDDLDLLASVPQEKTILVWNKIDCTMPQEAVAWGTTVLISAKERLGLEELRAAIEKTLWRKGPPSREEVTITSLRHKVALLAAGDAIRLVAEGLKKRVSPEFVASDMRCGLNALGTIIGINVTEEILSSIFSQFCLGK